MAIFDHTANGEAKGERERGWVDEVLRTNGDKKDNVDFGERRSAPPSRKDAALDVGPGLADFQSPSASGKQAQGGN